MQFAFVGYDRPDGNRMGVRPAHLKHLESLGERLLLAGPFLDEKGEMVGSFMLIEAENQAEAEAIYGRDPFVVEGVFESYSVRPFRLSINNTAG